MNTSVSNCVATKRQAKKVTQAALAEAVSVSRQTIIAIEKGNYTPSVALALSLAKYFDCQVEDIFC